MTVARSGRQALRTLTRSLSSSSMQPSAAAEATQRAVRAASLSAANRKGAGDVHDDVAVRSADVSKVQRKPFKEACFYQIYPRSFADGNNDGIGDLKGITDHLEHIADLGTDVIWLSPIFASPNDDCGYDISDYRAIMPEFGTMDDFEAMTKKAKGLGLKVVLDLVVNHCSDEHEWFQESMKSRDNPKADWFIWRDPVDGGVPNNWKSNFGGSAWKFVPERGQYFLHLYSGKQPDLNWENPEVRKAAFDVMHFWKSKGADGFRMDVINEIGKPDGLPSTATGVFKADLEKSHKYMKMMNEEVLSKYPGMMTVGEMPGISPDDARKFTDPASNEINMCFGFEHMYADIDPAVGKWEGGSFSAKKLKETLNRWDKGAGESGWNTFYLGNHDWRRMTSRFAKDPANYEACAKALHTVIYTGRWTPFMLAGDEIGMTNTKFASIDDVRDIESINYYKEETAKGVAPDVIMAKINDWSRDHSRTPMQWTSEKNGGFSASTDGAAPWIGANPNHETLNVAKQKSDPSSVLAYCKDVIALRKNVPTLVYGTHEMILPENDQVYGCVRRLGDDTVLVLSNLSDDAATFTLPASLAAADKTLLLGTDGEAGKLAPFEARIYRLAPLSALDARLVR